MVGKTELTASVAIETQKISGAPPVWRVEEDEVSWTDTRQDAIKVADAERCTS
jgi:hypothetical protein